ncbi:uncharacterized protein BT62DRAFT_938926 [Guyanagaster necrorhizus]|uniref:Uncharacterized protein n=1 Tax=Guyanagaster necrorhizus TaxID=856835 RepID=A0A9P7VEK3_9AGAR|nr:uncharacterized protein BT62DRAFT_938926 [Guyanagaster necrorhizus MCA 3950]KAG7439486.1 hypothetical protein BT62DRAFT_938926 [Guyanagaster necrorhizus MCA 3950]
MQPPRIEHLTVTARSAGTRKSNMPLLSLFPPPFDNHHGICANQTGIIWIGKFLPRVKKTFRSLDIAPVDNGASTQ